MLRKILPHVSIVLCNMYLVFFCIDRVNSAMSFIDNNITKALLLVLCIISTVNSAFLILDQRRKIAAREAARRRAARNAAPQTAMPHRQSAPRSAVPMPRSRFNSN